MPVVTIALKHPCTRGRTHTHTHTHTHTEQHFLEVQYVKRKVHSHKVQRTFITLTGNVHPDQEGERRLRPPPVTPVPGESYGDPAPSFRW